MNTTYQAIVTREDGWWMVHVPEIDGLTNSRRLADAEQMARELIAVTLDLEPEGVAVTVTLDAIEGIAVRETLDAMAAERAEAARLEADARTRQQALARELSARAIPLRDIGAIFGVSHQRAAQLVAA
ncbi:MAG: hypothetical protein FWD83_07550 [Promicromonosporaceae bacterium]|nr:hypothetical protein [Promicromonosporaceae bacterium]